LARSSPIVVISLMDGSPLLVIFDDHHLGTSMPSGGHPPHQLATSFILAFPVATDLFDFAKRIIQDMPDEDRTQGDGCSVGITDGERAVGRIRCSADH